MIQCTIATILIIFGKSKKRPPLTENLQFDELFFDYTTRPVLQTYTARNGSQLSYRHYPTQSDTILVLLHGSGWHSRYFLPLANELSAKGVAQVYTPDLRGHGPKPERRGDIDYINQLEDDVADLIELIRTKNPGATVILGGHSSGGGLAIRFAGSRYSHLVNAYLLLSPYLTYNAPTMRRNSGGWTEVHMGRIIGLSMLHMLGIHWFDFLPVIGFNMPEQARDGTETLAYSHRLNTGYAPRNYKKDLSAITQPLLLLAGTADDAFVAEAFEPTISPYATAKVVLLPDITHMGVVVGSEVQPEIITWLSRVNQ